MKKFDKPNTTHGFECPICHSGKEEPVVLVPIPGTQDGNICQAAQVHAECYALFAKMHDIQAGIEE